MIDRERNSIADALHIFEQDLLVAAVIELRCAAVSVAGNSLCHFQSSPFSKKFVR
jgi:hypothetical protein